VRHPASDRFTRRRLKRIDCLDAFGRMASLPILTCLIGGPLTFWWLRTRRRKEKENPRGLSLPPGPKPYPIIQNLLDVPLYKPWLVYNEWFKTYGAYKLILLCCSSAHGCRGYGIFESLGQRLTLAPRLGKNKRTS
jgi:hypothetical protein